MTQLAHRTRDTGVAPLDLFWIRLARQQGTSRRRIPRVHADVPVRLHLSPTLTLKLRSNDVAIHGMQIRCDRRRAECIRSAARARTGSLPTFPATLRLAVGGLSLRVSAHARVAHLSLIPDAGAEDEVVVGFQLAGFESGGELALLRFVEQHLCPA